MKPQKSHLLFTALAAVLLAGFACRLPFTAEPVPATPTSPDLPSSIPPTLPAELPGPLPTNTPPPDLPTPTVFSFIPHYPTGAELRISEIKMLSPTDGWAIGRNLDGEHDHILYTRDGGETWRDVTPPEANTVAGKRALAFFLDANTAWVTYAYQDRFNIPENPVVWRTTDGGTSWASLGTLNTDGSAEFFYPGLMTFTDAETGWLAVSVGAGMNHDYSYFYRTTDGGVTWEQLHNPSESVHLQSCCKTGMHFADALTGLVTQSQGAYAEPYVEWTQDGGLTWEHQTLPLPPELADSDFPYCDAHSPRFFDSQNLTIGLTCKQFDSGETTIFDYLYKSTDSGQTWQVSPYPGGALHMLTFQQGFATSEEVYFTSDGGQTWDYQGSEDFLSDFHFSNAQYGWAIGRDGEVVRLFSTQNGGQTWGELFPVIGQ